MHHNTYNIGLVLRVASMLLLWSVVVTMVAGEVTHTTKVSTDSIPFVQKVRLVNALNDNPRWSADYTSVRFQ